MNNYIQQALDSFRNPDKFKIGMTVASTPIIDSAMYDLRGKKDNPVMNNIMALNQKARSGQELSEAERAFLDTQTKKNVMDTAIAGALKGVRNGRRVPYENKNWITSLKDTWLETIIDNVITGNFGRR